MTALSLPGPEGSVWTWPDQSGGRLRLFALTAVTYAAGSQLAITFIEQSGLQGVFFIPAGITVGFMLRTARRHWWLVAVAAGAAETTMDLLAGYGAGPTAGFVAGNMAEPLVGALIVTSAVGAIDLARLRHVLWFLVGAVFVGPAVGAAVGTLPAYLMGERDFLTTFPQWWLGDALAVLIVGSAIVCWGSSPDRRSLVSPWGLVQLGSTVLLTLGVRQVTHLPLLFLVLVGVIVAGSVFGTRAVAMTGLVVALTFAIDLAFGADKLVPGLSEPTGLVIIKLQLAVFTIAGLIVAAEAHEREVAARAAADAAERAAVAEAERRLERQVAVRLQTALLPGSLAGHPNLDAAARYEAGSKELLVGGDWYDVFALPQNRIALTIGDVVGHGVDATAAMGRLRTALAALAPHTRSPAELLAYLDEYTRGPNGIEFATALYCILDPETGVMSYASAGHPPTLVVSPGGDPAWLMDGRSPPFHDGNPHPRSEGSTRLEPGSLLIAYSDGLVERRGEDIGDGLERLAKEARELVGLPAAEVCDLLVEAMGVAHLREDDVVVLAMRYRPG